MGGNDLVNGTGEGKRREITEKKKEKEGKWCCWGKVTEGILNNQRGGRRVLKSSNSLKLTRVDLKERDARN